MQYRLRDLAITLLLALCACAHTPIDDPADPLQPMNRAIFSFNEKADKYVVRPVAKGYVAVVPGLVRSGVNNFLSNLFYPTVFINDALQAKFRQSGADFARFIFNSTVGIVGIFDPATKIGLERHDEDFGQTFGIWGLGSGWYLVIPLLGPSSNRDFTGRIAEIFTSPTTYMNNDVSYPIYGLDIVDTRAQLLGAAGILDQQLDPYISVRSAYLQRRESMINGENSSKKETKPTIPPTPGNPPKSN